MSQPNQNNSQSNRPDGDSSGDVSFTRKRGRPRTRKYPRPDEEGSSYIILNRGTNQKKPVVGNDALVPPGFEAVVRNQQQRQREQENDVSDVIGNQQQPQREQENDINDVITNQQQPQREQEINLSDIVKAGQVVSALIEEVYDVGILLSVKIGSSDTSLRGLVSKPGYVPITPQHYVAVGVPLMVQSNMVPFLSATPTQVQNPLPMTRNDHEQFVNIQRNATLKRNESPSVIQVPRGAVSSSNLVASLGNNNVPFVADQRTSTLPLGKGKVVPIVLQPVNPLHGVPVPVQLSHVMNQASLGGGTSISKDNNNPPTDGNQTQTQTQTKPSPVLMDQASLGRGTSITRDIPIPIDGNQIPSFVTQTVPSQVIITQTSPGIRGTSFTKEIPVDGNRATSSRTQTRQNASPRDMQSGNVVRRRRRRCSSANVVDEIEARTMRLPSMAFDFEKLVNEVVKRIQASGPQTQSENVVSHQSSANVVDETEGRSMILPNVIFDFEKLVTEVVQRIQGRSADTTVADNSRSGGKTIVKDSSSRQQQDQVIDLELQESAPLEHSASASRPSKMTGLLQAKRRARLPKQKS